MARILVTGNCGFIGSWLTKKLINEGHEVWGIDDLSGGSMSNLESVRFNFHQYFCSCCDEEKIDSIFSKAKPDVVYHLAANAREGASFFQPVSIVKRNTLAYSIILMNSIKYGVKRVITFSSIAAYGDQKPPFMEDTTTLRPVDLYGQAKATMEGMTRMLSESHGISYVILRPFNVYGPYQALNDLHRNVFGIWMNKIMRDEPLTIYGDGLQQRAFSYIEDSLPCYINALSAPSGAAFNVGSSKPYTILEAMELTLRAMGIKGDYPVNILPDRHKEVKVAYTDTTRARNMLGLKESVDLPEGLRRMAEWAKKQGPQEWKEGDPLEIPNKLTPEHWKEKVG